jgi:hypothetical protein
MIDANTPFELATALPTFAMGCGGDGVAMAWADCMGIITGTI